MNNKLKAHIVERFGHQWKFAQAVGIHEAEVSRVIRGHRTLSETDRQTWASVLGIESTAVFDAGAGTCSKQK